MTGFVVLQRGPVMRRIPFWLRVTRVKLGPPARVLTKQGRYEGNTRTGRARVSSYRYPDDPAGFGVSNSLPGPEQVFRVRVQGSVANVGVRITRQPRGVSVTPRLVYAGDENRLAGIPALPVDINPYRGNLYGDLRPVVAANRPSAGAYDVVFETRSRAVSGPFSFRVWIDDKTPPRVRLLTPTATSVAHAVRGRQRVGRRSAIDHRPRRRPARGIRAQVRPPQRAARRESDRERTGSPSASRTSRRRRTRRASSGSSRTRRSSGRRSAFASGAAPALRWSGGCRGRAGRSLRSRRGRCERP